MKHEDHLNMHSVTKGIIIRSPSTSCYYCSSSTGLFLSSPRVYDLKMAWIHGSLFLTHASMSSNAGIVRDKVELTS